MAGFATVQGIQSIPLSETTLYISLFNFLVNVSVLISCLVSCHISYHILVQVLSRLGAMLLYTHNALAVSTDGR